MASEKPGGLPIPYMLQAGVILSDYATLIVEILKDNARPEAGEVYEPWTWAGPSLLARSPEPTKNNSFVGRFCECKPASLILQS